MGKETSEAKDLFVWAYYTAPSPVPPPVYHIYDTSSQIMYASLIFYIVYKFWCLQVFAEPRCMMLQSKWKSMPLILPVMMLGFVIARINSNALAL